MLYNLGAGLSRIGDRSVSLCQRNKTVMNIKLQTNLMVNIIIIIDK